MTTDGVGHRLNFGSHRGIEIKRQQHLGIGWQALNLVEDRPHHRGRFLFESNRKENRRRHGHEDEQEDNAAIHLFGHNRPDQ